MFHSLNMGFHKTAHQLIFAALTMMGVIALVTYRVYIVLNRAMPPDLAEVEKIRWLDELGRVARGGGAWMDYIGIQPGTEPFKIFLNTAMSILFNPLPWQRIVYRDIRVSQDVYADVPVSIYTPVRNKLNKKPYPTMIFFHGGGWTWLSVGVYDGPLKNLANSTGFKIIAVEYRTAPQFPFPAPYEDCLKVTKYIIKHSLDLNVHKDLIVVAGDGAGGNLAAAVANELGDQISLQLLINPALQSLNFATPSYQDNSQDINLIPGITSPDKEITSWIRYAGLNLEYKSSMIENRHISLDHYKFLADYIESKDISKIKEITSTQTLHNSKFNKTAAEALDQFVLDSRFNPLFATNVRNSANAYIITSQFDVLRDEAIMYADRLQNSGKKVELQHYRNGFHGFFMFAGGGWLEISESKCALHKLVTFLNTNILTIE